MKATTLTIGDRLNASLLHSILIFIFLLLTCVNILPAAQAVSPAPNGGLPGGNTAEGQSALLNLGTGTFIELKSIVAEQRKGLESKLAEQRQAIEVLTADLKEVTARVNPGRTAVTTIANNESSTKERSN